MTRDEIDGRIARDGNRGFLMRNDRKDFSAASEEERRKPDYTGRLHCGGVLYFVAAWVKKLSDGRSMLSVSAELAAGQDLAPGALRKEGNGGANAEPVDARDLPF